MTEQGPESLSGRLRAAREQSGLSLRQIADITKLSVRQLDALENNRVTQLPSGIYRRSIVRTYAREVGLDPEIILREFLAHHPDDLPALAPLPARIPTSYDLPVETPVTAARGRVLPLLLSVLGALIPIAAGIFYFTIAVRGADVPRHVADITLMRSSAAPQTERVPVSDVAEISLLANSPVAVMITVSSPTELQIVADGREIVARKLAPGELVQFELSREIVLAGDNAGAVHLSMNGRAGRGLGVAGAPLSVRIGRDDYDAWLAHP